MLNSRSIAIAAGLIGACLGLAAVVFAAPALGLAAGVAALGAGAAIWVGKDSGPSAEQLDAASTHAQELEQRLATAQMHLETATGRISELELDLATADDRPEPDEALPTIAGGTAALVEQESQLFSEAYFRVALDARIASARRHLRPVAIALIDIYEGIAGPDALPAPAGRSAESIRQTVRDADTACRLEDGTFAIILEDTPENGAVWTVERIRRNLVSRFGSHTMWAGVACYPAHAFSADELLEQAQVALDSAREWKQDRIEVAIAE